MRLRWKASFILLLCGGIAALSGCGADRTPPAKTNTPTPLPAPTLTPMPPPVTPTEPPPLPPPRPTFNDEMPRHVLLEKRMPRDAFVKAVMGKNQEEVLAAVGRPTTRQTYGDSELWMYKEMTGVRDCNAELHFRNGVVVDVTF